MCACTWHYIGIILTENKTYPMTWIIKNNLEEEDWFTRYIYSIYWATITTLTIGYGDITPVKVILFLILEDKLN